MLSLVLESGSNFPESTFGMLTTNELCFTKNERIAFLQCENIS